MNTFFIPANTKKGSLIFGLFRPFDLILLGTGVMITLILLLIVPLSSTAVTVIVLTPGVVCAFLVMPIPFYHNMLNVIGELIEFLFNRQKYYWKGWCITSEKEIDQKQ